MKGLGFVGAGNMGEAMIRGILGAKLLPRTGLRVLDARPGRADSMSNDSGDLESSTSRSRNESGLHSTIELETHHAQEDRPVSGGACDR